MAALRVFGNDTVVTMASSQGNFRNERLQASID